MKSVDEPITLPSITGLTAGHEAMVVVAGSHGGKLAAEIAASFALRAVILNDAGIGLDNAGIAGLDRLADLGMAAATVDWRSARIGDGADMLERGIISHANRPAQEVGLVPGMAAAEAARLLRAATPPRRRLSLWQAIPVRLAEGVWGADSASDLSAAQDGAVVMTGSHGGLPGGDSRAALRCAARAALFNDAGIGRDEAGIGRLPVLDRRGIPAATVDALTARIGEARSTWESGILSRVNAAARARGAKPGMTAQAFAALFA